MAQQRKPKHPMTQKQVAYIHALARERGLRWATPYNPETTASYWASTLIDELQYRFSLHNGLFIRDYINTGIFEIVDQALAESYR